MKRMNPDTALALMLGTLFLLGVAFGAVCGGLYVAAPVPALQVTVQAQPAPFVAFGPDVETLREEVGGCSVSTTGNNSAAVIGSGNVVVTGRE